MADINGLVQAIIQAANAQAANAPPAQQPPNQFALLPGLANAQPLDYNRSEDMKIFHKAIAAADDKFDLKESTLRTFLDVVKDKARIFNWNDILDIPDDAGVNRNLLTNFGQLTMENCTRFITTHIGQPTRQAQNDIVLYQFLSNSLTQEARLSLLANPGAYTIGDTPSGVLFLKTMIGKASIDTRAKVLLLRRDISTLPTKMVELKGNVREFNLYVEHKRAELLGRGQSVDELIAHLFQAYVRVPNEEYVRYINSKKDAYEENAEMTADELMALALCKYDLMQQQNAANDDGEERIIAMYAADQKDEKYASKETMDTPEKLAAMLAKLASQVQSSKDDKSRSSNSTNSNRHRISNASKKNDAANAWKKVKPASGSPSTKVVSGRTYHWCPYHEAWTMHSPTVCTLAKNKPSESTADSNALMLNKALLAMMSEDSCN